MTVYLVRHAKAGDRHRWAAPDEARPLSAAGRRQAKELANRLAAVRPAAVLSSPSARCVQTVEPLARALGTTVEIADELDEGRPPEPVVRLLLDRGAADGADLVLCSHGDVIPDLVGHLRAEGMDIVGEPDWRKGATWVLEVNGGDFRRAHAWPPPDVGAPTSPVSPARP